MFSEVSGRRLALTVFLQFVMVISLVWCMTIGLDDYFRLSIATHPEFFIYSMGIALLSAVLIVSLTRKMLFIWSTLAMAMAFTGLMQSLELYQNGLASWTMIAFIEGLASLVLSVISIVLFKWSVRMLLPLKK